MLKETGETILFFVTFLSLLAFQFGVGPASWLCLWYNRWLRLITMLLPGPDLHCAGPGTLGIFATFSAEVKTKIKSYHVSAGLLAL